MIGTVLQGIVGKWNLSIPLYNEFAPQDTEYPYCTLNITPSGMQRSFDSDMASYSVSITVWTQESSSSYAQSTLNTIKQLYNRRSVDGLVYCLLISEIVVKDTQSHFYTGSSTFDVAVGEDFIL